MTDDAEKAVRLAKEGHGGDRLERAKSLGFSGPWYHGTERLDRLLSKKGLDPKRATSGPMPYFTDNPEIASNYAVGKADTSRVAADEGNPAEYFKVHPKHLGWSGRSMIPVEKTWMFLPHEKREEIARNIARVGYEDPDTQEGKVILHPEGSFASLSSQGHLDDMMREHRGNALSVIRDLWHDSGHLFGNEDQLAHVYKTAGYPHPIDQTDAPWTEAKGVLPAMLRMRNPLDAMNHKDLLERVIPVLERDFKHDRSRRSEYSVADQWHKNHRWTPKEWVSELKKDAEEGKGSYVWTSMPDKVTNVLKRLGHDAVIDKGAKMDPGSFGGHTVAIPFHPHQVRSTMAKFDPEQLDSPDIGKARGGSVFDFSDPDSDSGTKRSARETQHGPTTLSYTWHRGAPASKEPPYVSVDTLLTPSEHRRKGHGRAAMEQFLREADAAGVKTALHAEPYSGEKGVSKAALEKFYGALGYKAHRGHDPYVSYPFVREPQKREERRHGGRINTAPTEAQKVAGNYKKGHIWIQGLDISIENPKGSKRSGVDPNGKPWSCTLPADYGYIRGTEGADGDHVDVYLGPERSSPVVFVVNQHDHRSGRFDEHKCMIGYRSEREALRDYCAAFSDGKGRDRARSVETMSMDAFKRWLKTGRTKTPAKAAPIIEKALALTALRSH